MTDEETCKYSEECRVRQLYWNLCFLNMNEAERKAIGNKCLIAEEYEKLEEKVDFAETSHLIPNEDTRIRTPYFRGRRL